MNFDISEVHSLYSANITHSLPHAMQLLPQKSSFITKHYCVPLWCVEPSSNLVPTYDCDWLFSWNWIVPTVHLIFIGNNCTYRPTIRPQMPKWWRQQNHQCKGGERINAMQCGKGLYYPRSHTNNIDSNIIVCCVGCLLSLPNTSAYERTSRRNLTAY